MREIVFGVEFGIRRIKIGEHTVGERRKRYESDAELFNRGENPVIPRDIIEQRFYAQWPGL